MHRGKKKRNIIILSLVGVLLCMVVGYAAFNTELKISGTSKVTSNWDIRITNVTDGTPTGSAKNTVKPSWTTLTASMEADLYKKGDAMEYDVTIENRGTLDAKLNDILTNTQNSNSEAVIITFSGYTKGEVLEHGKSKLVHVKIEYNPNYEGEPTSSEVEIEFEYTQENKDPEAPSTYLLTYDYKTNGGEKSDSEGEYLTSGSKVDLNIKAYKNGWTFVGWNTDKDALVGLTEYQMPVGTSTLYAIYKKEIKVTYNKGSNIESIGKNSDICTIYNRETECEITLPTITPNKGYIIDGWYSGSSKVGNPDDKYTVSNNVTLTSKVKQNTYTVTYDYKTNGGTSSTKTTEKVDYGDNIDLTPTATKSGWTFVGWNTNKDATTKLSSLTMGNSNVTLYAIYRKEAKTITITFNKNGATSQTPNGGTANSNTTLTQSCTIPAVYNNATQATTCNITSPTINASSTTPTVIGYNTSASATSSSWNQKTAKAVSANATYYAITRKDAVTLTAKFNANGASLSNATNKTCTLAATYNGKAQGTSCTVTAPTISRSGYTIIGYNTSASATTNNSNYNTSSKVLTLTTSNNNSTWYAITSKGITATFNANGATIGSTSQSCMIYNTNTSCNITTPSITRSGFTITGWGTSSSSTTAEVKASSVLSLTANKTYYAVTSKKVTVTYSKGSNVSAIGSTSGICTIQNSATNCQVTLPTITPNKGYIIDGWYSGSSKIGSPNNKYTVSSNTTLTSKVKVDNISLSISTTSTTNSITVVSSAKADSGISKYEYRINGGNWIDGNTSTTHNFTNLNQGTSYTVEVRVTSKSGKTTTTSKIVTTKSITTPTFSEDYEGEVVITYPSGCGSTLTCTYQKDNESAVTITSNKTTVYFPFDGNVVAKVSDGVNTLSSTYNVKRTKYYVLATANDNTGAGTFNKPYKTIQKTYDNANDNTTIYLKSNINQDEVLLMDDDKEITLTSYNNTYSILRTSNNLEHVLRHMAGNLTLENITIDGQNILAEKAMIENYAYLTIEEGTTIKNGYNSGETIGHNGGIYQGGGTLTMNEGLITNNRGVDGGVHIANGTFVMNNGTISNNIGEIRGGVQIANGTFVMNSGSITNNTATESAPGGLNIDYGTFEIHGGTIEYNSSQVEKDSGHALHNITEWQSGNSITHDFTINPNFVISTSSTSRYQLISGLDNNKTLSIEQSNCNANNGECNIWIWSNNKDIGQKWMPAVESIVNGKVYYKIYNIGATNHCIDTANNGTSNGTRIQSYVCNSTDGQRFYLENAGDGYYYIKHKTSNKCLDVSNGQTANGTKIQLYTCNNTTSQKWKFVQITN